MHYFISYPVIGYGVKIEDVLPSGDCRTISQLKIFSVMDPDF